VAIAINKDITNVVAVAGAYTLTLSDVDGILIGAKADIEGFPTQAWNVANVTITAVDETNKTVSYSHGNATIPSQEADANFHLSISWISVEYVEDMLGFVPTGDDLVFLDECVEAAEDWAYRKRAEAGYNPHPGYAGGADVRLGTGLYAMSLYRERGAAEGFASYETMGIVPQVSGGLGRIMQLLGCGRPQVA